MHSIQTGKNVIMLLHVNNLTTAFKMGSTLVPVVDSISFTIEEGSTFALLGESGCGKSITALSILRLIPPSATIVSGQILYEDEDLARASESRIREIRGSKIGMIFQEPQSSLNPLMKCGYQILEALMLHGKLSKKEARSKACSLLEMVGIPDAARRFESYPHELSGGMQQRIMIAIALACSPQLLIADEPTTALDVTIQAQILDLLNTLKQSHNLAMLLISHDLGVVAECADTVGVMYCGRIVEMARVAELFSNPLHPYTIGLHDAIPRIDAPVKRLETIQGFVPSNASQVTGCAFHPRCKKARLAATQTSEIVSLQTHLGMVPIPKRCALETPLLREYAKHHWCACWEVV